MRLALSLFYRNQQIRQNIKHLKQIKAWNEIDSGDLT